MSAVARHLCPLSILVSLAACGPSEISASETSTSTEASSGATSDESSGGSSSSETGETSGETGETSSETGAMESVCGLFLRIDLCCNQAFPADLADIEAEADLCVVPWPVDWEALPADQLGACVDAQPQWCEDVDCDFAPPASEIVEFDEQGVCRYVCPEDQSIGYSEPGCAEPPPIAACLFSPDPCADEFCSCAGETIFGCGYVGEPFAHAGPCQ